MFMHPNVVKWNDFLTSLLYHIRMHKHRLLDINYLFPWNALVNHELYLDLDKKVEALRIMEEKVEEPVILDRSLLLNQSFSRPGWSEPTGWGDEEDKEVTKSSEPYYAVYGWESNQHKNYETNKLQNNSPWYPNSNHHPTSRQASTNQKQKNKSQQPPKHGMKNTKHQINSYKYANTTNENKKWCNSKKGT
ncbi:hypothetical protein P8452_66981 [Trifolium repens]|nr:hypothetical protein P8452_66981 [Trifolium repens]